MSISYGEAGAVDVGTTSLSIDYPANIAAGNLLIVCICNKYPTNGPADISGWTKIQASGGPATPGVDTGQTYSTIFYKTAVGTESGSLSVTITSGNSAVGIMFRYANSSGAWDVAYATGAQNTNVDPWTTTNAVTAASDPGLTAGDILLMCVAANGNTRTFASQAVTASGITAWGTMAERQDSGTNNGDDCSLMVSEHPVSTGTSTAAPVFAADPSAACGGGVLFFRMRESTPPAPNVFSSLTLSDYSNQRVNPLRTPLSSDDLAVTEVVLGRINPLRGSVSDGVTVGDFSDVEILGALTIDVFDSITLTELRNTVIGVESYTIASGDTTSTQWGSQKKLIRLSNGDLHAFYFKEVSSYTQIFQAISYDGGQTWSETQITSGSYNKGECAAAPDSNDNIHLAFEGRSASYPDFLNIYYMKYTGSWSSPANITTSTSRHQEDPVLVVDAMDDVHITWFHGPFGDQEVSYIKSSDGGSSWGSEVAITQSETYTQFDPCMVVDSSRNVHIVWLGGIDHFSNLDIRYKKYTVGVGWGSIQNITTTGTSYMQGSPVIAVDSNDILYLLWKGNSAASSYLPLRFTKSSDGGANWDSVINLWTDDRPVENTVSIAVDQDNNLHAVWTSVGYPAGYKNVYYRRYSGGSWGSEVKLTYAANDEYGPTLLWSKYPCRYNTPDAGFVFIWVDGTTIKIGKSTNLAWSTTERCMGIDESVAVADFCEVALAVSNYAVDVFDATAVSENVTKYINPLRAFVQDSVAVSEFTSLLVKALNINVFDQAALSDFVNASLGGLTVSVFDGLTVTEAAQALVKWLQISVAEAIATSELPSTLVKQLRPFAYDNLAVVDQIITRLSWLITNVFDQVAITEVASSLLSSFGLSVSDDILIAEFITAGAGINGFVLVAPSIRFGTLDEQIDNYDCYAQKFVCPGSGQIKISEIGLFCKRNNEDGHLTLGIFTHDATNNCPETLVTDSNSGVLDVNSSTITKFLKNYDIEPALTGGETYWLVFQLNNSIPANVPSYDYREV